MSRFHASVKGAKDTIIQKGTTESGIQGHIRGWDVGVNVDGYSEGDDDVFVVYVTSGSNSRHIFQQIGDVRIVDGKPTFIPA